MVNPPRITDSEKQLLHAIGNHPEASIKELLEYTEYKWERTIKRKLKRLKERDILQGPIYYTNYSRVCKNPLHKVLCIIESNQSYETVISYLKVIESLLWILPVLSPHKRVMKMMYYSTDNEAMIDILQLLKENGIISDYVFRIMRYRGKVENPNLYGDINPALDNLLDPCDIPDMSLHPHDTHWNECDIAILPYLERGTRLIEILREENHNSKTWTYEQIKYSREKMVKNGLIEKLYMFFPFPLDQCLRFGLFLKTEDTALTHRIVHNFARGERINKQSALHEGWGDITIWGSVGCATHPLFLKDLMHKLDAVEEIVEREVYQIRSFPHKKYFFSQPSRLDYYDVETQTMEYPYHVYEEKIKEKLEQEPVIISV